VRAVQDVHPEAAENRARVVVQDGARGRSGAERSVNRGGERDGAALVLLEGRVAHDIDGDGLRGPAGGEAYRA
jgi:hypothetical protein